MEAKKQRDLGLGAKLPELPEEIWGEIGKRVPSRLDVTRFRSVCRTWRSSLPAPSRFPLRVPPPPGALESLCHNVPYFINEDTYYRLEPESEEEPDVELMVLSEVDQGGKFHPRGFIQAMYVEHTAPAGYPPIPEISLLTFLTKVHALKMAIPVHHPKRVEGKWEFFQTLFVRKLVLISPYPTAVDPRFSPISDLTAVAVLQTRALAVLRLANSLLSNWDWETISSPNTYSDIIYYNAKLHAVDLLGRVWVMDYHSLQMSQVSALPSSSSDRVMRFVESSGQLYIVVVKPDSEPPDINIYKLRSQQWVQLEGQDLVDQVLFLYRDEAFSLPRHLFADTHVLNLECIARPEAFPWQPPIISPVEKKAHTFPFRDHTLVLSNPVEDSDQTQLLLFRLASKPSVNPSLLLPPLKPLQPTTTSSILAEFDNTETASTNYLALLNH